MTRLTRLAALVLAAGSLASAATAAEKVTPKTAPLAPAALAGRIDQHVQQRLQAEKIPASPLADDAEFLRRVYLDLTGVIPTAEKAAAFLDSKDSQKRAKLIDELLASPEYGRHQADIWQDMLLPRTSDNRRLQNEPFIKWLETNFNENKPWNQFVYDLLTSSGKQDENGAVTFYLANPTVDKMTDLVGQHFLGVRLQCAQCHNHPFTGWKQSEYWGVAQFFYRVQADKVNNAAKNGTSPGIVEGPRAAKKVLPESAKDVPAKFLMGAEVKLSTAEPARPILAKWITSPDNAFFAKAMVNRTWYQLFGKGLVNPVDDMHADNKPTHPAVLDELTQQFVANGYDLKGLIRSICNSQTYQRTSKPTGMNEGDAILASHMTIKTMSAEQLYDSLVRVVGTDASNGKARPAAAQKNAQGNGPRAQFVNFFRVEEGADPTEYEVGIPQVLRLMNSPQFNKNSGLLTEATKAKEPAKVIETLYLGTLSRRPTADELKKMTDYVAKHDAKNGYQDVLWVLLNSSEFTFNR